MGQWFHVVLCHGRIGLRRNEDVDHPSHQQSAGAGPVRSIRIHQVGWTAGGGIEAKLAGNWSAKVEYLYVDLGDATETILYPANNNTNFTTQIGFHTHVARLGLNYHFGGTDLVRARD